MVPTDTLGRLLVLLLLLIFVMVLLMLVLLLVLFGCWLYSDSDDKTADAGTVSSSSLSFKFPIQTDISCPISRRTASVTVPRRLWIVSKLCGLYFTILKEWNRNAATASLLLLSKHLGIYGDSNSFQKGITGSDIYTENISIFFYYMGDDKDAPSAKVSIRCKEHEHPFEINCFGNNREWGIYHYLKREYGFRTVFGRRWILDYRNWFTNHHR